MKRQLEGNLNGIRRNMLNYFYSLLQGAKRIVKQMKQVNK